MRFRPDGAVILPSGERIVVEVELHGKADRRGDKLAWYQDGAGYTGFLWRTHREGVHQPLEQAIARAGGAGLMWVELLPAACLAYAPLR